MSTPSLGVQELDVLRYVSDHAPATVGEVADGFGAARGLARTTVQTVMERLCAKGCLTRRKEQGIFRYAPAIDTGELIGGLVHEFVQRTLEGSVQPLVTYLVQQAHLDEAELEELRGLLRRLDGRGKHEKESKEKKEGKERKKKKERKAGSRRSGDS